MTYMYINMTITHKKKSKQL